MSVYGTELAKPARRPKAAIGRSSGHPASLPAAARPLGLGLEVINHGTVCLLTPKATMSRTDANSGVPEFIPIRWGGGGESPSVAGGYGGHQQILAVNCTVGSTPGPSAPAATR